MCTRFSAMPSTNITKIGAVTEKAKLSVAKGESIITVVSLIKISPALLGLLVTLQGVLFQNRFAHPGFSLFRYLKRKIILRVVKANILNHFANHFCIVGNQTFRHITTEYSAQNTTEIFMA